jgi:hypothetical protein
MPDQTVVEPVCILRHAGRVDLGPDASTFTLENRDDGSPPAEVVLDSQRCEGGLPIFAIDSATGSEAINIAVVYSEGVDGIDHATGAVEENCPRRYADDKKAMGRSSSSPTPWTRIAVPPSTYALQHRPKQSELFTCSVLSDTRKSLWFPPIRRSRLPGLGSSAFDLLIPSSRRSPVPTLC